MLRRTYETAVSHDRPADAHLLAAYMAYIRLEQVSGRNAYGENISIKPKCDMEMICLDKLSSPLLLQQHPLLQLTRDPSLVLCNQQAPSGGGEPSRVQCCYERAISVFPVTTELWMQYGERGSTVRGGQHDAKMNVSTALGSETRQIVSMQLCCQRSLECSCRQR